MADETTPRVAQVEAWPDEWDTVPADRGKGVFRIDVEGGWYHDGLAITQPRLVQVFAANVTRDGDGTLVLRWGPYDHPLAVADTPDVIQRAGPPRADGRFPARLVDRRECQLDVATLAVGARHVMYARAPDGEWVRFSRPAYYQMAAHITATDDGFAVVVGDHRWRIGRRDG